MRLRHVDPARVPLRHAAPSPSELPDSLHLLAEQQSHRPTDFLSGHAPQDGKGEHRGDYAQEADTVGGICGAHGGHQTTEVRDIRRTGGGRGLRGRPGKIVDGVSLGRPPSFRYRRRPVDDCSPRRGRMAQDGGIKGGTFHGEINARAGLGHAAVCPNVTGRTKGRIAPNNRVRAGSLAIVNQSQVARTFILRVSFCLFFVFWQVLCCLSLASRLFCFVSFSSLCFHSSRDALRPIVHRCPWAPTATRS